MSKKFLFTIVLSTDTVLYKGLETGNIVDVSIVKNNNDPYAIGVFKDGVQLALLPILLKRFCRKPYLPIGCTNW